MVFDGNYSVYWLTTRPATKTGPTVSEITAGTDISDFVPKDGVSYGAGANKVDISNIGSNHMDEAMGTHSTDMSITVQKDGETDTAWDLFQTHPTTDACLVILPNDPDDTPANGDEAFVINCEASQLQPQDAGPDTLQTAVVSLAVQDGGPEWNATVQT